MSNEIAENNNNADSETKSDFWLGFGTPVGVGLGISFCSMFILMNSTLDESMILFIILFSLLFNTGHSIIWPLIAVGLMVRGNSSRRESLKNGAILSLKLYAAWIIFVVFPIVILFWNFNGIV